MLLSEPLPMALQQLLYLPQALLSAAVEVIPAAAAAAAKSWTGIAALDVAVEAVAGWWFMILSGPAAASGNVPASLSRGPLTSSLMVVGC
jgi:xanthine/uracil/vitamin C permease (AzgA family)